MAQQKRARGFDTSGVKGRAADGGASRRRARSLVSAAQEVPTGQDEPQLRVPLTDLVPYPGNPVSRQDEAAPEIQELAESISQIGVLQPAVVVPAGPYVERHPQDAEAVGGARFVVLAGVQRWTASRVAGVDDMPVVVRTEDELVQFASSIALHENFFRKELTPLEEARALERVMSEHGFSQRALSKHLARSQSQISKRLRLLQLPVSAQDLLESGRLPLQQAGRLLDALDLVADADERALVVAEVDERLPRMSDLSEFSVRQVCAEARDAVRQRQAAEAAKARAEDEGLRLINPGNDLGESWPSHQLRGEQEIEQARGRGDLAIAVSGEDVTYYQISEPAVVQERRQERQSRKDEQAEARRARKARESALKEIVASKPKQAELVEALTRMVLSGDSLGADRTTLARSLAQAAGVGPADPVDWDWKVAAQTHPARAHLAWIGALAAQEARAHASGHRWDAMDREYLRWLTDRGYVPTGWERAQLDAIPDDGQGAEDESGDPVIPVESPEGADEHVAAEQLRASHRAEVVDVEGGHQWVCSCGQRARSSSRTPAGAQAAMNRHLQGAFDRILRDVIPVESVEGEDQEVQA